MNLSYLKELDVYLEMALKEDIGDGDHTTLSTIPEDLQGKAELKVKDDGIIAGMELAPLIFAKVDPALRLHALIKDGDPVKKGDIAFYVIGNTRSIVTAERLVLNCMQRMSGIATLTHHYTQRLAGLKTRLLDTRKTTPNFRIFEKWAVHIGGGINHRFGLFDMILIKDNHIDYAGSIEKAITGAQAYLKKTGKNMQIEIEARNLEDVEKILRFEGIQRILLDNFSPEKIKEALSLIKGAVETEASGGITYENLREYGETGVDFISSGALTHSVKSLDLSLKAMF